jgi:cap1 methyltransferase
MTGEGGIEGDGDIFRPENQKAFIQFVKDNTDNQGVHVVMADGVCLYNLYIS